MTSLPPKLIERILAFLVKGRYGKIEIDVADGQLVNVRFTETIKIRDLN